MKNILKCDDCGQYSSDYTLLGQECTECSGTMRETDRPYSEWEDACKTCCHYATAVANEECIRGSRMNGKYCAETA